MDNFEKIQEEYELAFQIDLYLKSNNMSKVTESSLVNDDKLSSLFEFANRKFIGSKDKGFKQCVEFNSWLNYWRIYGGKTTISYRSASFSVITRYFANKSPLSPNLAEYFFQILLNHKDEISGIVEDEFFSDFIINFNNLVNLTWEMTRIYSEKYGIVGMEIDVDALGFDLNDYIDILKAGYQNLKALNKS